MFVADTRREGADRGVGQPAPFDAEEPWKPVVHSCQAAEAADTDLGAVQMVGPPAAVATTAVVGPLGRPVRHSWASWDHEEAGV